ncbi:relaxase/mobilization nuclease domain-containing protein [Kineococcus gypseus]|uniref:relaxase/mobilization nuclease domain-containing protein n=1 Tax=Kineococcus gypseus TaxID=1637102 RepID=UPI003D7EE4E6
MPNITRGERMGGLLAYLAGPGKANEHVEPHLVAGDAAILAWHDDAVLDAAAAAEIARQLEAPRMLFGVQVAGGAVWHCSLSLRAEEGVLSDEKWAEIARDFVEAMGFSTPTEGPEGVAGPAPCRWVAIRHGLSAKGNDHVHLAVSLVREDGSKADVWNDRPRAQRVCTQLEHRHGLEVLASREAGLGERGLKPAELARAQRTGGEPERVVLTRRVRAAAAIAASEADFVRAVRADGLLIRPRYAAGRDDVVLGYSVALRPQAAGTSKARTAGTSKARTAGTRKGTAAGAGAGGTTPLWFGGSRLARDLTLPRLREQWPDSVEAAAEAVQVWRVAKRSPRVSEQEMAAARRRPVSPQEWVQHTQQVQAFREYLRAVPIEDHATWAQVARESAGAFAAWSRQVEPTPGPLAEVARALARTAQVRAHASAPRRSDMPSVQGAALALAVASGSGSSRMAQAVMLRQLANTMKALHDALKARGEAQAAKQIASVARHQLRTIAAALPEPLTTTDVPGVSAAGRVVREELARTRQLAREAARQQSGQRPGQHGQQEQRALGSPVPARLQPGQALEQGASSRVGSRTSAAAARSGRGEGGIER